MNGAGPDDPLWHAIRACSIGPDDAALTFADRLARENRWSGEYAGRVVVEYKRFCYLACVAGHAVTPSDQIDQAWHLHLTYSSDYWDGFCRGVLGRPFHHGPTEGGEVERGRFYRQYAETLASYEDAFGEVPPEDIWSPASKRFGVHPQAFRVHTDRWLVVPGAKGLALLAGAAIVLLAIGFALGRAV